MRPALATTWATSNHGWPASRAMHFWPTAPVAPSTATGMRDIAGRYDRRVAVAISAVGAAAADPFGLDPGGSADRRQHRNDQGPQDHAERQGYRQVNPAG